MPNRLAAESSPYLRQHAGNPVDWYPWGPEALARSAAEDRPILLSIGYSACHWCHVMERESFEDPDTAALMNEGFVNVKVDREERPDLDNLYQTAAQLLRRGGGWPLTCFLLPDGRPFYIGTYFPDTARHGLPAFSDVLRGLRRAWHEQREKIEQAGGDLQREIVRVQAPIPGDMPGPEQVAGAAAWLTDKVDPVWGGLGQAPKFPSPSNLEVLLRGGLRGDRRAVDAVLLTLRKMEAGGVHDQVAGGFHRYATDRRWCVPHFEKMLYDNAQLVPLYLHAWRVTGDEDLLRAGRRTLDYLLREMTAPDGVFFAATDADSEGEEGRFFVWSEAELRSVLPEPECAAALAVFDVRPEGNWEGKNILWRPKPWEVVAADLGVEVRTLRERVDRACERLRGVRSQRVPPALDDKILVSWNALTIQAFVAGWRATGDPVYRDAASRAGESLLRTMFLDGQLQHSRCGEDVKGPGLLDDHAAMGAAALSLFEVDGRALWLDTACRLAEALSAFSDGAGGWYQTPAGAEPLFARPRDTHDSAVASGASMAASFLLRLWAHTGEARWRDAVEAALRAHGGLIVRNPYGTGLFHAVLDTWWHGFVEVVLAGEGGEREAMERVAARHPGLDHLVLDHRLLPPTHPAATGRAATSPTAWVCRHGVCSLPVTTAAALEALLDEAAGTSASR